MGHPIDTGGVVEKGRHDKGISRDPGAESRERRLESFPVNRFSRQDVEASEDTEHQAVGRWRRGLFGCFQARDDRLCIVGRQEIAAGVAIPIMNVANVNPGLGLLQIEKLARDLVKQQRRARHAGLVVQNRPLATAPATIAVAQPTIDFHAVLDEEECPARGLEPVGSLEDGARSSQGRDRQAVPVGQHHVVAYGPRPLVADLPQGLSLGR